MEFSKDLVVDENLTVLKGAVKTMSNNRDSFNLKMIVRVIESLGDDPAKPFKDLREDIKEAILFGTSRDIP
jgi:excinuclease ABC subunit A